MTIYRTCRGCKFEKADCETRKAFAAAIKPLAITSVKWRCAVRAPLYRPGALCYAQTVPDTNMQDHEPPKLWFPAVVCSQKTTTMYIVYIAPETLPTGEEIPVENIEHLDDWPFQARNRGYCRIPLIRMRPREGDPVHMCKHGTPLGVQCDVVDSFDTRCPGAVSPMPPEEAPF